MTAHFALLFISLTTLLTYAHTQHNTHCPHIVDQFIHSNFETHTDLLRRGAATKLVQISFTKFLHAVHETALNTYTNHHLPFKSVCLQHKQLREIRRDSNRAKRLLERIYTKKNKRKFFFLRRAQFPQLPPLVDDRLKVYNSAWQQCCDAIQSRTTTVNVSLCVLPRGVEIFYDPHEQELQRWKNTFLLKQNTNHLVPSADYFVDVLTLILRLKLLRVPNSKSKSILDHLLAFTFNIIRSNRIDGENLILPNAFFLWYKIAFNHWTRHSNTDYVQYIYTSDVKALLGQEYLSLLIYEARGSSIIYDVDEYDEIVKRDLWKSLISKAIIKQLKCLMHERYNWFKKGISPPNTQSTRQIASKSTTRMTQEECEDPSYWTHVPTLLGDSECCADACFQYIESTTTPALTLPECCEQCNKVNNCTSGHTAVREIMEIHIRDYGDSFGNDTAIVVF